MVRKLASSVDVVVDNSIVQAHSDPMSTGEPFVAGASSMRARLAQRPRIVFKAADAVAVTTSGTAESDAAAYQTSKGAATMLTKSLAKEFGPFQIRVNSVCPIASETPMWAKFMDGYLDPDEAAKTFAQPIPLGRLATPEDVAAAALFFASDDSAYVTGVNLPVDGGSSA